VGAKKKRKRELTQRQFIEWALKKWAEEGKAPPANDHLRNMWRAYRAKKKSLKPPPTSKPTVAVDDPTQRPCGVADADHEWNRERYGLRCLRCGGKVTGNPVNLWKRVVVMGKPAHGTPTPPRPKTFEQRLKSITAHVSREEVEAKKTPRGGWTKKQLAEWGVPWPPPKGWRMRLEERDKGYDEMGSDSDLHGSGDVLAGLPPRLGAERPALPEVAD
jgi:hypothetical protein